jgi:hypothetical protein
MHKKFFLTAATLLLAGCTTGQLETLTLLPARILPSERRNDDQSGACNIPLPGQGLSTTGTGPSFQNRPREILVGFEDAFQAGAPPIPCNQKHMILYRGNVAFDLKDFDSIVAATLEYDVIDSFRGENGAASQFPPTCAATSIGQASVNLWDFDDSANLPSTCTRPNTQDGVEKPSFSVGVSGWARSWIKKSHVNAGIVFVGRAVDFPKDLPEDNKADVTWYGNFRLVILYNPDLNRRLPKH